MLSNRAWRWVGALIVAASLASGGQARAQAYPDRPVKMIVGFAAGGTIDTLSRILADKLGGAWNQSVIVDNRPGGGGNIGSLLVAHAEPDGLTLLMGGQQLSSNVTLQPAPNFDPARDLAPVIFIGFAQDVLMVGKDSPFHSLDDIVKVAKAKPGALNYASLGSGSSGHLATALLCDLTGMQAEHVPYTSLGQGVTDLISGRLSFWLATLGGHLGNIRGGNVRALAVSGAERAKDLPDVPTFKELGVALVEPSTWFGIYAPKGTPKAIVAKIHDDLDAILRSPETHDKLISLGYTVDSGTPEKLAAFMAEDTAKWAKVAKTLTFGSP